MDVFEGSEKKCEAIIDSSRLSLRKLEREFWVEMVVRCEATILSEVHNEECDAYLLSESSLFVWDDHFLLITCGQTKLVESILYFLDKVDTSVVKQLLFQRKNEYYSDMQHSDFAEDVRRIEERMPGVVVEFGDKNLHYTELFHLENSYEPESDDRTYELLMYGISKQSTDFFMQSDVSIEEVRNFLQLQHMLPDWQIDDFLFTPCGYSLNAIHGDKYLTIHVTPQQDYSYISLETNVDLSSIIATPIAILQPQSFDLVLYQPESEEEILSKVQGAYDIIQSQTRIIDCGYAVSFIQCDRRVSDTDGVLLA